MKTVTFTLCILLNFCLLSVSGHAVTSAGEWHQVRPKYGDGIATLLTRYDLHQDAALLAIFCGINELTPSSPLYRHKSYKLPVKIFIYNGTSIRSTIGINDWDKAVRIKEYNERLLKKGIRSTHYTESKLLWVPANELSVSIRAEKEVATSKSPAGNPESKNLKVTAIKDNLYGQKYAHVPLIDQSLKGRVYYIVSGHGGPDPGARCVDCSPKLCEDEYAYDVSLRLARNLRQHGAKVEMVIQDKTDGIRDQKILGCDSSERLADGSKLPLGQLKRLQQRTDYINKKYQEYKRKGYKDQLVLSLHIDSNSASHEQDVFFCYYKESKSSRALAITLRDKFQEKYDIHQKNRGYKGILQQRNFYVLRKTSPPAVLIELANIRNRFNHKRILPKDNRQALANWIFEGLQEQAHPKDQRLLASSN